MASKHDLAKQILRRTASLGNVQDQLDEVDMLQEMNGSKNEDQHPERRGQTYGEVRATLERARGSLDHGIKIRAQQLLDE